MNQIRVALIPLVGFLESLNAGAEPNNWDIVPFTECLCPYINPNGTIPIQTEQTLSEFMEKNVDIP